MSVPWLIISYNIQTDRGKRRLNASGPVPDNIRTIPFFEMPVASGPAVTIQSSSQPDPS